MTTQPAADVDPEYAPATPIGRRTIVAGIVACAALALLAAGARQLAFDGGRDHRELTGGLEVVAGEYAAAVEAYRRDNDGLVPVFGSAYWPEPVQGPLRPSGSPYLSPAPASHPGLPWAITADREGAASGIYYAHTSSTEYEMELFFLRGLERIGATGRIDYANAYWLRCPLETNASGARVKQCTRERYTPRYGPAPRVPAPGG